MVKFVPLLGLLFPTLAFAADNDGDGFDETVDCDDTDARTFPGADEACDGLDNDCDGLVDEDCGSTSYPTTGTGGTGTWGYPDVDLDGYDSSDDCDDNDPSVHPGAPEICNGIDDDCDREIDDNCVPEGDADTDADSDSDTDGDTDADSDADSDTDADTDADADTGRDTGLEHKGAGCTGTGGSYAGLFLPLLMLPLLRRKSLTRSA